MMPASHHFDGQETFDIPRERLWEFLTDIRSVPRCLTNLEAPQFPSPDSLTGKLDSKFSFLHGKLDIAIQITDRQKPVSTKIIVTVRGIGCRALIHGSIELAGPDPAPGPTSLRWQADARLEGLLSAVSKGLIEGAARKLIAETFQTIRCLAVGPQAGGTPCL